MSTVGDYKELCDAIDEQLKEFEKFAEVYWELTEPDLDDPWVRRGSFTLPPKCAGVGTRGIVSRQHFFQILKICKTYAVRRSSWEPDDEVINTADYACMKHYWYLSLRACWLRQAEAEYSNQKRREE